MIIDILTLSGDLALPLDHALFRLLRLVKAPPPPPAPHPTPRTPSSHLPAPTPGPLRSHPWPVSRSDPRPVSRLSRSDPRPVSRADPRPPYRPPLPPPAPSAPDPQPAHAAPPRLACAGCRRLPARDAKPSGGRAKKMANLVKAIEPPSCNWSTATRYGKEKKKKVPALP